MHQIELLHIVHLPQDEQFWNVSVKSTVMFLRICKNFETQCFCFPEQTHFTIGHVSSGSGRDCLTQPCGHVQGTVSHCLQHPVPLDLGTGLLSLQNSRKRLLSSDKSAKPPELRHHRDVLCWLLTCLQTLPQKTGNFSQIALTATCLRPTWS